MTDKQKEELLKLFKDGKLPVFDSNDETKAKEFVNFFNIFFGKEVLKLETHKVFKIKTVK